MQTYLGNYQIFTTPLIQKTPAPTDPVLIPVQNSRMDWFWIQHINKKYIIPVHVYQELIYLFKQKFSVQKSLQSTHEQFNCM